MEGLAIREYFYLEMINMIRNKPKLLLELCVEYIIKKCMYYPVRYIREESCSVITRLPKLCDEKV
jgi:hypothetical protein